MGTGKIDLVEAQKIALRVKSHVASAVSRIEIAGSIRRCKSVVGDVEFVAIQADQEKFVKLLSEVGQTIKPGVPDIIPWVPKPGAKYIRVRLAEDMNLDVFLGTRANWGGLFMMRTGSGSDVKGNVFNGFVPGMFGRFKKLSGGGRMTGCMPTMPSGEQLCVYEEKDFFDLLEMNFVPPEERIDKKVIKRYIK